MAETKIHLPSDLPYPIKITSLVTRLSASIQTGQRLLNYSFLHLPNGGGEPETRIGSWDATFEGTLQTWKMKIGDVITRRRAKEEPAIILLESCQHGIQVNGMCALCGMDMDNFDYTGRPESSRANIQMTHSSSGPVVSLEEAQRIEQETAEHLLKSRKLSLIVDLDQTIVHATVDPTVGDWIGQSEAWEKRHEARMQKAINGSKDDEDGSDDSDDESDDEYDPNWDALKDIKKFRLATDVFDAFGRRPNSKGKGKASPIEIEGCLYYIKPRPGWKEFLSSMSEKYEMHVYTMGTRAYAEEVCRAIDPDSRMFGGRILSRDESGSLTQKSLQRLFPCDTSMVVIIDDRADVWDWSPNLVKVIPYDFFIGIGDINSTFLPTLKPLGPPSIIADPSASTTAALAAPSPIASTSASPDSTISSDVPSSSSSPPPTQEELAKEELITQNILALEAQVEERPLARKQEELLRSNETSQSNNDAEASEADDQTSRKDSSAPKELKQPPKILLSNEDYELMRVGNVLDAVHQRYFDAHDARKADKATDKSKKWILDPNRPDVRVIIRDIRLHTFAGVHILFSGVIPTNSPINYEQTEIWSTARAFGATCHREFSRQITHVVTTKRGTQKVEQAQKEPGIFVVWFSWFTDSVAQCKRQDERPYLLEQSSMLSSMPSGSSPPSDPSSDSFDIDSEATEEETKVGGPGDDSTGPVSVSVQTSGSMEETGSEDMVIEDEEETLDLRAVDWQDVNDEVDAAMMESDSEGSNNWPSPSGTASELDPDEASQPSHELISINGAKTPPQKRKRLVSFTPSESGRNPGTVTPSRRPSKRSKDESTERQGLSDLSTTLEREDNDTQTNVTVTGPVIADEDMLVLDEDESEYGVDEEEEEEEEDFLAGMLEEEDS